MPFHREVITILMNSINLFVNADKCLRLLLSVFQAGYYHGFFDGTVVDQSFERIVRDWLAIFIRLSGYDGASYA